MLQVSLAQLVQLVHKVLQVSLAQLVLPGQPDQSDRLAQPVHKVLLVLPVHLQ